MTNKENGLIEKFYEIHSKQYAVAKLLSKGHFELKKHMVNTEVKDALLKINDCFSFCNVTNTRKLVPVNDITEKILLIKSTINPKSSHFATKIVVKYN